MWLPLSPFRTEQDAVGAIFIKISYFILSAILSYRIRQPEDTISEFAISCESSKTGSRNRLFLGEGKRITKYLDCFVRIYDIDEEKTRGYLGLFLR